MPENEVRSTSKVTDIRRECVERRKHKLSFPPAQRNVALRRKMQLEHNKKGKEADAVFLHFL